MSELDRKLVAALQVNGRASWSQVARALVAQHPLRSLDAVHLAVARTTAAELAAGEPVVLVTRDHRQAAAAEALGMAVE